MTDTEFRMFSVFIKENCGLHFGEESRFLLEKRLLRRMRELELGSFSAYHYRVRNATAGDDEIPLLIDELTTNETYFFREYSQLRALIEEIFVEIQDGQAGQGGRPINVWCAGCSTGDCVVAHNRPVVFLDALDLPRSPVFGHWRRHHARFLDRGSRKVP